MDINTIYLIVGIVIGVAGLVRYVVSHLQARTDRAVKDARQSDALDRNTEATEKLNESVTKLGSVLDDHEKRISKVEYKLWPS